MNLFLVNLKENDSFSESYPLKLPHSLDVVITVIEISHEPLCMSAVTTARTCARVCVCVSNLQGFLHVHFPQVANKSVNLSIGALRMSTWEEAFSNSLPYCYGAVIFAIPRGRPYTAVEMLFLPFDSSVWICITAATSAAIVAMGVLKLGPLHVRDFVVGRRNDGPFCNLVAIILGARMPTHHIANRNIARTILTVVLLATLVLRNAYQGTLFNFLRTQQQRSPLFHLQDMWDCDVDIYVPPTCYRLFMREFPHMAHR